jgi:DNA processing protein
LAENPLDTKLSARDAALPWLRLTLVPGVDRDAQRALLNELKPPHDVARAPHREIVRIAGAKVADAFAQGPAATLVDATLRWLEQPGCRLVALGDPEYPQTFLNIADPPTVFYAQGRCELLNAPALAIVGSRNATPQGVRDAEAFARELSQAGLCIVSGLAIGIDAAAHRGGLAAAGSSIAVMGTGPDVIYPRSNRALARQLAQHGCMVSEFPLGMPPLPGNFPQRNRLISGLARGVLVVEASLPRSGSLITARSALDQGRDVFAIPGSIHSPLAKGCHWLIQQGAKLVENAADVLCELGYAARAEQPKAEAIAEIRDPLLDAMGFAPASIDQIAQRSGLDAATLAARLSRLEIEGRVEALAGGRFQRAANRDIE